MLNKLDVLVEPAEVVCHRMADETGKYKDPKGDRCFVRLYKIALVARPDVVARLWAEWSRYMGELERDGYVTKPRGIKALCKRYGYTYPPKRLV